MSAVTSYLYFVDDTYYLHDHKTRKLIVNSSRSDAPLGEIRWFGRWRQYCFFPVDGTIFNKDCLNEIAQRCDNMNKIHRHQLAMKRRRTKG